MNVVEPAWLRNAASIVCSKLINTVQRRYLAIKLDSPVTAETIVHGITFNSPVPTNCTPVLISTAIIQEHEYCIKPPFILLFLRLDKVYINWLVFSFQFPQVPAESRIITSKHWCQQWLRVRSLERAARRLLPCRRRPMLVWKCRSPMTFTQVSWRKCSAGFVSPLHHSLLSFRFRYNGANLPHHWLCRVHYECPGVYHGEDPRKAGSVA